VLHAVLGQQQLARLRVDDRVPPGEQAGVELDPPGEPRCAIARREDQELRRAGLARERRRERCAGAGGGALRVEPRRQRDTARCGDRGAVHEVGVAGGVEVHDQLRRPDGQTRVALREAQVAPAGRVGLLALERELRVGIVHAEQRALAAEQTQRGRAIGEPAAAAARGALEHVAFDRPRRARTRPQPHAIAARSAQQPAQRLPRGGREPGLGRARLLSRRRPQQRAPGEVRECHCERGSRRGRGGSPVRAARREGRREGRLGGERAARKPDADPSAIPTRSQPRAQPTPRSPDAQRFPSGAVAAYLGGHPGRSPSCPAHSTR
jgi:hypothetical protein